MATQSTSGKTRSPNYPSIDLGEAIQRTKTIYDQQQQYPATRDILAKLLGYKGLNGASATVVSALSKYGLLEGHGDSLRVSDLGQDLALHRKGDSEYAVALEAAAFMPAFFRELHDQFPSGLPHDHSLRATLVKRGFNPKSVDSAVRAYRDTMAFLDSETDGSFAEPDSGNENGGSRKRGGGAPASSSITIGSTPPMIVILSPTLRAEITFHGGQPTPRDLRILGRYLELSEEALAVGSSEMGTSADASHRPSAEEEETIFSGSR